MRAIIDVNQGAYFTSDIIAILNEEIARAGRTSDDRRTVVQTNLTNLVQIITD